MPLKIEKKHHNIVKAGVLYLASGWLIVQTVMSLTPVFDWPPIFAFGILFMLIPGYPIVLMMVWAYEVIHRDSSWNEAGDARKPGKGFQVILGILTGLAMLVVLLDIFLLQDSEPAEQRAITAPQVQQEND